MPEDYIWTQLFLHVPETTFYLFAFLALGVRVD